MDFISADEEVVTAVEEWVNGKDPDFLYACLKNGTYYVTGCVRP